MESNNLKVGDTVKDSFGYYGIVLKIEGNRVKVAYTDDKVEWYTLTT